MAHQPYQYGLPFQFPPHQMPTHPAPSAPSDAQGASQQLQHAPPSQNAFHIPGLHHAPPPNVNHTSYSQNAHQPSYPPAAWPQDPNAFFAMMQHAAMAGQPPPPLPGLAIPPQPPLPPTARLPAPPMAFPPPPPHQTMAASERIHEVMDSDKEDGEVSESESATQAPPGKPNARTFPELPRSVPHATQAAPRVDAEYNPNRPADGQTKIKEAARTRPQQPKALSPEDEVQQKRAQAKQFIKLLQSNNIGYRVLAKENLDLDQLRGLYQSMNLPSEPAPILPPKETSSTPTASTPALTASPAVQPVSGGEGQKSKPAPTLKTNVQAVAPPTSAPSPVDRKDYIARLQAAKLAKLTGPAKPSLPSKTPPVVAASAQAAKTPQAATTPTAKPPITDEQRARNTELIKQRLEAMRAKKQMTPAANVAASAPSSIQQPATALQTPVEAAPPAPSGISMTNGQSYTSPFPGIPGLFMNPPPSFENSAAKTTPSIPQKRPAPPESTELSTPRGSATPYTRPLGESPHAHQEVPMIIEVSEDESNGSEMDIDDDHLPPKTRVASPPTGTQRQISGAIPDFTSRQTSVLPGSSAVSTPGPQTPTTQARENELKRKEDQLAAMRLTLKKKLAEKREKDKAAAAAVAAVSSPAPQNTAVSNSPLRTELASASADALGEASELIRDVKRRRREEIQSRLPSFDAELAVNTDRIAQLMKEMENLKAQSQKITQDKEQLTRELENLGVDTEGMSHAEMRAKKDEIEHEMSPEPDMSSTNVNGGSGPMELSIDASSAPTAEVQHEHLESKHADMPNRTKMIPQHAILPGLGNSYQHLSNNAPALTQATTADEVTLPAQSAAAPSGESHTSNLAVADNVNTGDTTVTTITEAQDFATPLDEDDFYSPAPAVESTLQEKNAVIDDTAQVRPDAQGQAGKSPSPSEEGEIEMSVSSEDEEEEYEPEEPAMVTDTPIQHAQDTPIQHAQAPEVATAQTAGSDGLSTEDEEAYEPPDVDERMPDPQANDQVAEIDGPGPELEAEVDDGAMDIASSSEEDPDSPSDSDSESEDGEIASQSGNDETTPASHAMSQAADVAIDSAPELQPGAVLELVPAANEEVEKVKFTPYESPLRMFKSYRYHPNFPQDVAGGFLSTTFSHQIDPERPLCQYETAGGSCNDAECPDQHFRDLSITGAY
ncbi:hypothetical protein BDU57DRAFT_512582 [Ampelomyces quisqualis]|uniref:Putative zinc-finger domain-containing protein n=1 Tax=Ampelomyces quisqualis TaxID=50730 RepID=A0A6A5QY19_AMPQU|nr:hypothetical protein BDU57DRAFT_512582 [Ampelomyces quisqualis]